MVLAVGTELGETDYDVTFDGGFAIDGRLIRIDIDAQQLMRNARAEIAIAGDAQLALGALSTRLHETPAPTPDADWGAPRVAAVRAAIASMHDGAARSQARLIDTIVATLPGAIIAGDSTAPSTSATSPTTHRRRAAGSTRRPATARSATGCPPRSAPSSPRPRARSCV